MAAKWGKKSWTLLVLSFLALAYAVVDFTYSTQNNVHATWHELIIVGNLHGFESTVGEVMAPYWYAYVIMFAVWGAFVTLYVKLSEKWRRYLNIGLTIGWVVLLIWMIILDIPHQLTDREKEILSETDLPTDTVQPAPVGHTVLLLGESWESWALDARCTNGDSVCRYMLRYMDTHPCLFVHHLACQKRHGVSGDGQLIIQAGMLPLRYGVAAMTHPDDPRESYIQHYPKAVLINSTDKYWHWQQTAKQYGYDEYHILPQNIFHCNDSLLLEELQRQIERADTPTFFGVYTISTHNPYKQHTNQVEVGDEYTACDKRYLNCCAFSDRQIGRFLQWADTAACMKNARIIFTSDHNIFPKDSLRGACVFLMSSPNIRESRYVEDAYQMDVYTTIVNDMGIRGGWRGFGINLLDSTAQRGISAEEALTISDWMIRHNYFENKNKK